MTGVGRRRGVSLGRIGAGVGRIAMIETVHIVSTGRTGAGPADASWGDEELAACARVVGPDARAVVIVVGPSAARERARLAGLRGPVFRVGATGCRRGVARVWEELGRPPRVACWGRLALDASGGLPARSVWRLLLRPDPGDTAGGDDGWQLPLGVARGGVHADEVIAAGDGGAPLEVNAAVAAEREHAGSDVPRLLLVGREPHASAMRFVFLVGLLREAGVIAEGVVASGTPASGRGRRFGRAAGSVSRVVSTTLPRAAALRGVDLAVWAGGGTGPTRSDDPVAGAAARAARDCVEAGVPMVAPRWAVPAGVWLDDERAVLGAENATLPELVRVLSPLVRDGARRTEVRAMLARARPAPRGETFEALAAAALCAAETAAAVTP